MTRKLLFLLTFVWASCPVWSQDFSAVLSSIEQNSLLLQSARQERTAQQQENRAETALEAPEVGFNYLWGNGDLGRRIDLSASQEIPMPHQWGALHRLKQQMQQVAELSYLDQRQALLLYARKLCIEVVYCNAAMHHLNEDLEATRSLADAYQKLYERGEATAVDHNKAHQSLLLFEAEYREFQTLHANLLAELRRLNGGGEVQISDSAFQPLLLAPDASQYVAACLSRHPELQLAQQQARTESQRLRVAKGEWVPKLRVGYMAELEKVDHYQGLTLGMTLPSWQNARRVKAAQAHAAASALRQQEVESRLATHLQAKYAEALQYQQTVQALSTHLQQCDNTALLHRSLESGQMTLITFLQECQFVHEIHEKLLAAQRDMALALAELEF